MIKNQKLPLKYAISWKYVFNWRLKIGICYRIFDILIASVSKVLVQRKLVILHFDRFWPFIKNLKIKVVDSSRSYACFLCIKCTRRSKIISKLRFIRIYHKTGRNEVLTIFDISTAILRHLQLKNPKAYFIFAFRILMHCILWYFHWILRLDKYYDWHFRFSKTKLSNHLRLVLV